MVLKPFPILDVDKLTELTCIAYGNPKKFKDAVESVINLYNDVTTELYYRDDVEETLFTIVRYNVHASNKDDEEVNILFDKLEALARVRLGTGLMSGSDIGNIISKYNVRLSDIKYAYFSLYTITANVLSTFITNPSNVVWYVKIGSDGIDRRMDINSEDEDFKPYNIGRSKVPSIGLFGCSSNPQELEGTCKSLETCDGSFIRSLPTGLLEEILFDCSRLVFGINRFGCFINSDIGYTPEDFSPVTGDLQTPRTIIDLVYNMYKDEENYGTYGKLLIAILRYYSSYGAMPNFERDLLIAFDRLNKYPISVLKEKGYEVKELVNLTVKGDSENFLEVFKGIIVAEASAVYKTLVKEKQEEQTKIKEYTMNKINFEKLGSLTNIDASILKGTYNRFGEAGLAAYVQGAAEGEEEAKKDVEGEIKIVAGDKSLWEKFKELPWWQQVLIAAGATAAVGGIGYLVYKTFFAKEDEWTEIQVLNGGN